MKRTGLFLMIALLFGAEVAEAQRRPDRPRDRPRDREARMERVRVAPVPAVGLRGLYDFDARDFGVGAQAEIPLGRVLRFVPSGEVYLGDETTWQANADVALSLLLLRLGGGLGVVDAARTAQPEGNVALGLNLFAGIQGPPRRGGGIRPFAEARWTFIEDATPFRLAAGFNVPIGGARR